MKKAPLFSPQANQDLRSWVIFITKCARQVVIARRRSRRGVHVDHRIKVFWMASLRSQ
jgi:hypothetical protein